MNKPQQGRARTPAPSPVRKKSGGGTLVGLFVGIVIGLLCAFGVVLYLQKSPLPFMDKSGHVEPPASSTGAPLSLPGKPGEKPVGHASDKPRFEFYKILPGGQEATPQMPQASHPPAAPGEPAPTAPPLPGSSPTSSETVGAAEGLATPPVELLYLQAGAFQKAADADNLKAKLALMGLETSVLEANVPDKGTMYRVRVGPFRKADEMNRARNQLSQGGIQASLVKIKQAPASPSSAVSASPASSAL